MMSLPLFGLTPPPLGPYFLLARQCVIRVTVGDPDDEPMFAPGDKKRNEEVRQQGSQESYSLQRVRGMRERGMREPGYGLRCVVRMCGMNSRATRSASSLSFSLVALLSQASLVFHGGGIYTFWTKGEQEGVS